ncbi:unnamed protein product [Moneuplotes crassus]|uniref:Rab-GAP TBC domain-containing protein n=1 Tax=Euplotes crassus TaxID=5936 RepID=A0AAD1U300_EUPCR|nr:unnamed protein product [Moneuplotes crassus]
MLQKTINKENFNNSNLPNSGLSTTDKSARNSGLQLQLKQRALQENYRKSIITRKNYSSAHSIDTSLERKPTKKMQLRSQGRSSQIPLRKAKSALSSKPKREVPKRISRMKSAGSNDNSGFTTNNKSLMSQLSFKKVKVSKKMLRESLKTTNQCRKKTDKKKGLHYHLKTNKTALSMSRTYIKKRQYEKVQKYYVSHVSYYQGHRKVRRGYRRSQLHLLNYHLNSEEHGKKKLSDPSPFTNKRVVSPNTVPKGEIMTDSTPGVRSKPIGSVLNISIENIDEESKFELSSEQAKPEETSEEEVDPEGNKERKEIKPLHSFNSPMKQPRNLFCNCPMEEGISYVCTYGYKWIKSCFKNYDFDQNLEAYNALVEISNNKEIVDEATTSQIQKDLVRTFQKIDIFVTDDMKDKLLRVLKALVAYDPYSGYTQGINFITAALVVHCEESVTFWLCTGLFEKYEIRDLYSNQFEGMHTRIDHFKVYLQKYLPQIHAKFEEACFQPEIYMMNWILTFMCSYIPLKWLTKYFDEFFKHGWDSFHAICLSIHDFLQPTILKCEDIGEMKDCVNKMKENRDTITKESHFFKKADIEGSQEPASFFTSTRSSSDFTAFQRTRDEDWEAIFDFYETYIERFGDK